MNCPDCGEKLEYSGLVEGESDWVYRGYKCPNCGRDALGSAVAKLLNKAVGWYGGGAGVVPGKAEETMREDHYFGDFEWKPDLGDDFAKTQEVLEYLAQCGRALYPCWEWVVLEPWHRRLWERDLCGLKVRQWRGWGFIGEPRPWLENLEKYGVLLAVPEEVLLWLWREPLERKARHAEQIVRDMVEHAVKIRRDEYYPEFTPTIECEQEEEEAGGQ